MADGASTRHDLLLQETGAHNNDWGANLNDALQDLEDMAKGSRATATTGGTTTLTKTTSREPVQRITGVLASNAIIEVPAAATSWWFFKNETSGAFTVTVKVTGQTGVVVLQGTTALLRCDGTDVVDVGLAQTTAALTEETAPAIGDFLPAYDISAAADRKFTLANVFKAINGLTEDTAPHVDNDFALTYDASATAAKKITPRNLFKLLISLTEDTTPVISADYALVYDASASDVKKVLLSKLGTPYAVDTQTFTASGTWTKPSSGSWAHIELWGAGGGGGGGSGGFTGTGGGGGLHLDIWLPLSALGATETVTLNAGGVGGNDGDGTDGGTSTFGALLTAFGGGRGFKSGLGIGNMPGGFGAGFTSGSAGLLASPGSTNLVNALNVDSGAPGGGTGRPGGKAVKGGGGGAATGQAAGTSIAGGAGGATGGDGVQPGGGGGGSGSTGGDGARGKCIVRVY